MTGGDGPSPERTPLARFVESVERVWAAYRETGPGSLDPALHDPVRALRAEAEAWLGDDEDAIREALSVADDLARRCARTSLGLSFVSGEAGLIPRRDQHEALDGALDTLAARAAMIRGAANPPEPR